MSRVGSQPIDLPEAVKLDLSPGQLRVEGPKGSLCQPLPEGISLNPQADQLLVERADETAQTRARHGLTRSLIANMIKGVSQGFEKRLELVGIGFKCQLNAQQLQLNVGFSHPVNYPLPEDVKLSIEDNNIIVIEGIDKQRVGQVAAEIRAIKKPEPYKGKGIKYVDEVIARKSGKGSKEAVGGEA